MEHAGATFLRESSIIFPQEPTQNDRVSRAILIFHEAAHQWFGDTVTMKWFDDLWLKEGFANFAAYKALEKIMPEANAWKVFYERIKQGAYATDSTKGTTAIYQPIANLSAAKSAYGNIVYNKAPAFLRQAEFYLGEEKFQNGVRSFLRKHEFGNATWEDLLLSLAGYRNSQFHDFANPFVTQSGLPRIQFNRDTNAHSSWETAGIHASASVNAIGYSYSENFKKYGEAGLDLKMLMRLPDKEIKERYRIRASNGFLTLFPKQFKDGPPNPDFVEPYLIFPNYGDYGYGIFLLDPASRDYVLKNIQNEKDPFLRSMMWGALWDSVREGELDPREYVELVVKVLSLSQRENHPVAEAATPLLRKEGSYEDESTTALLLNRVGTAMNYYIDAGVSSPHVSKGSSRPQEPSLTVGLPTRVENMLIERMRNAETLGQRITYYRAFLNIASSENARSVLKGMLKTSTPLRGGLSPATTSGGQPSVASPTLNGEGEGVFAAPSGASPTLNGEGVLATPSGASPTLNGGKADIDIPLKAKDRFDIVTKLIILGDPDGEKLLAELEKTEKTDDAKRWAYAARAGIATAENKAKYWNDFVNNKDISESWIEAAFGPWNSIRHSELTLPYLERALKELPNHKRNRKIFFVNGWLGAFIGGQRSEQALAIVNKFLADNPSLDNDLRLKILENSDVIERAVKIRGRK